MRIQVYLRVGADNTEFEIGSFEPDTRDDRSGTITITDNDRPLAELLRRAADVIAAGGDLPAGP